MASGVSVCKSLSHKKSAFRSSAPSGDRAFPVSELSTLDVTVQNFLGFSASDWWFCWRKTGCLSMLQYKCITRLCLTAVDSIYRALWRSQIEMQSRDDRKTSFCSERMKLCQKHLAKVYGRSKNIFLRARVGKECSSVYPASVIRTDEDTHPKSPSQPSTLKYSEKRKVSPYLLAVSGLFDGPTLLRRLQFRSFQSSGSKPSPESPSPRGRCPKYCKDGEHDSGSVPCFFDKIPVSHSGAQPCASWASSRGTFSKPSAATHIREKDSATQVEQQGGDMGLLKARCSQRSVGGDTVATGRTRHGEIKSGFLTSRIGIVRQRCVPSRQEETDVQAQLGGSIKPLLTGGGKVDGSHCLLDSSSEVGAVSKSGALGTMVREYQHSKKCRVHDTGDKNPYSGAELVAYQPARRLEDHGEFCCRDVSASIDSIVGPTDSCFSRDPSALSCIPSLRPIRTREAPGNYGTDEDSSLSGPLLKYSCQPSEDTNHENTLVQSTQANDPSDFYLAPAETHDPVLLQSRHLSERTLSGHEALGSLRYDPTLGTTVRASSNREVQALDTSCNNPDHLERATRSNMKRLEKSSNRLWKYGSMALCTESPVRDYTTGSPPDFRIKQPDRKVSWSKSGGRKLVNHVCQVLKQHKWGPATLEALESLKGQLNSRCVNAVIQQISDPSLALKFFKWAKRRKGYKHDVYTYTTMINVLGRGRNLSGVRHLLEEMHKDGCEPTVVTYNTLILIYGKVESLSESLRVFRIMKEAGCHPDNFTYSILIHLCVKSGFLQEALKLYQGMLEEGIQPDTITYTIVIDSLGKAGNLSEARRLYREMKERGCVPNEFTYNSLIDRHAKLRQTKYALRYYQEMRNSGIPLNPVVCTTMMSVLASLGQFPEAEGLFSEMQQAGIAGDTAAYSLMINIWGQAGNLDKALSWYARMLGDTVTPSLSVFTSLVNAHLDLHLYEGAQHFLTSMAMWGISPDLKVYTSLLRHCTGCERQDHVDAVLGLMDRLGHPAHKFVFDLLTAKQQNGRNTRTRVETFFDSVQHEDQDSKQAFANALIEFLHKLQCKTDPGSVWEIALEKGLFPSAIIRREAPNHWLIDLHSMSVGTALVALPRLLVTLRENWVKTPTKRVYIVTGWGKRSRVTGSSAMKQSVNDLLEAAKSPFAVDHTNAGVFVSYGTPFCDWICVPLNRRRLGLDVAV